MFDLGTLKATVEKKTENICFSDDFVEKTVRKAKAKKKRKIVMFSSLAAALAVCVIGFGSMDFGARKSAESPQYNSMASDTASSDFHSMNDSNVSDDISKKNLARVTAGDTIYFEEANSEYESKLSDEWQSIENRKIIKNANLDIKGDDIKNTYNEILSFAKENGGYELNKNLNLSGNFTTIKAQIKIPPQKLDIFLAYIDEHSEIINCNISTDDVSAQYADTDIRLKTMRVSLDTYYKMLENAKNIDELLKVQQRIDNTISDIEAMQGKINSWDKQVSESVVTISMHEKGNPQTVKKNVDWSSLSASDMQYLIRNGFVSVVNYIVTLFQWIIIILTTIFPLLIIAGVVIIIVFIIRKKKKQR